jgi:predicted dehydrogenase
VEGRLDKDASRSGLAFEIEGRDEYAGEGRQPFFGLTVVSCERGTLRQSEQGILVYDKEGVTEVPCPAWQGPLKVELEDFYESVMKDKPVAHSGAWGKATLEICLAILQSSKEKREVGLSHQVPSGY